MVNMRTIYFALLAFFTIQPCIAQVSDHQRIGVEPDAVYELSMDASSSLSLYSQNGSDIFFLDSSLSAEFSIDRVWAAGITIPFAMRMLEAYGGTVSSDFGLGDAGLSGRYSSRIGDVRYSVSADLGIPTGRWEPYELPGGNVSFGSGRWTLGAGLSASVIKDPVVLGVSVSYSMGLPRSERYGYSWEPGSFSLGLILTEILNDSIGYSLRLAQSLSLPTVYEGAIGSQGCTYSASLMLGIFYQRDDWTLSINASKSVTDVKAAGTIGVSVSRTLELPPRIKEEESES